MIIPHETRNNTTELIRLLCGCCAIVLLYCGSVQAQSPAQSQTPRTNKWNLVEDAVLVEKPVWEFGLGAAYFSGYDYPASRDPNKLSLGLPFFIYRSDVVRVAGRGGLGAVAVEKPRFKIDVSIGGSLNAESSGNLARQSMPDLDFLFELGPRLNVLIARRSHAGGGISSVRFLTSARGVISTNFSSFDSRGFLLNSEIEWQRKNILGSDFDVQASLGTVWASRKTHDYFYSVPSDFATPERPMYSAQSGYLGSKLQLGFGYRVTPAIRLFAAVEFENFSGAANEDSPLFETDSSTGFAAAVVWTIRSSKRKIAIFEDD